MLNAQPRSQTLVPAVLALCLATGAVGVALLAQVSPLATLAIPYAIAFMVIAWKWPHVALALVLACVPFQKDLSIGGPVRFSIADIQLVLTVPVLVVRNHMLKRPTQLGPVVLPAALYLAVCLCCSLLHWRDTSLVALVQMGLYLVVAVNVFASFADHLEDLILPLKALVWVGAALAALEIALPEFVASPQFLDLNKNGIGASLASALIVAVELCFAARTARQRTAMASAVLLITAGLVFTLSRGAWLAALAGVLVILAYRRQPGLVFAASLLLVAQVIICWNFIPQSDREYAMGFGEDRYNISMRYESADFALDQYRESPLTGVGVGLRKEYDATNVMLLTLAETGVLGMASFLALQLAVLVFTWRAQLRLPRHAVFFSIPMLAAALVLSRFVHGQVDHYWSRGAITAAWATVGMAVPVYYASLRLVRNR